MHVESRLFPRRFGFRLIQTMYEKNFCHQTIEKFSLGYCIHWFTHPRSSYSSAYVTHI
ncbi:hypothetical protein REPUB_Repub16aG0145400 [Reevesia pubescens]